MPVPRMRSGVAAPMHLSLLQAIVPSEYIFKVFFELNSKRSCILASSRASLGIWWEFHLFFSKRFFRWVRNLAQQRSVNYISSGSGLNLRHIFVQETVGVGEEREGSTFRIYKTVDRSYLPHRSDATSQKWSMLWLLIIFKIIASQIRISVMPEHYFTLEN